MGVENIVKRGDYMEEAMEKSEKLAEDSGRFRSKSAGLKRNLYMKNMKLTLVILLVLLVAGLVGLTIFVITMVIIVCGFADMCTGSSTTA